MHSACSDKQARITPNKIFLIRHCDYVAISGELSSEGRKQAAGIASRLKAEEIDLILHSPVTRCRQTAEIVRDKLGGPRIESVEWLHEDFRISADWQARISDRNVLLVTHTPVIRQITEEPNATKFGQVTRLK
jgi:phosphohistidine phosphatase SixA